MKFPRLTLLFTPCGRSPCGERGLKSHLPYTKGGYCRRSPCGERGLKYTVNFPLDVGEVSLPVRGAWVEISHFAGTLQYRQPSLPVRGAWVEIALGSVSIHAQNVSLPVRGAWVEMRTSKCRACDLESLPVRGAWVEIPRE